jgi:hypothetical protein
LIGVKFLTMRLNFESTKKAFPIIFTINYEVHIAQSYLRRKILSISLKEIFTFRATLLSYIVHINKYLHIRELQHLFIFCLFYK